MAINLNKSIVEHKKDVLLNPAVDASTLERGMVMVRSGYNSAGQALVSPSAGAANEIPVGVLWLASNDQSVSPLKEELSIPAASPYTLTLREAPLTPASLARAYNASSGAAITVVAGTSPGAGEIAIGGTTGKLLTADSALAGVDVVLVYRFSISPATLRRRAGQRSINNQGVEDKFGQVTIAYGQCVLFVSNFDTEDAWDVDTNVDVLTGAGGRVSLDGSGSHFASKVAEPVMLLTPGLEQAFVGIECNLPGI